MVSTTARHGYGYTPLVVPSRTATAPLKIIRDAADRIAANPSHAGVMLLTIKLLSDACAARAALLARISGPAEVFRHSHP